MTEGKHGGYGNKSTAMSSEVISRAHQNTIRGKHINTTTAKTAKVPKF